GQLAVLELGQAREIVLGGVAVGRHAHDLELAIKHVEAQILGNGTIQATEGVRIVEFLDLVDLAVLAIAEEGGGVFTLAINTEDGGLFLETGAVVGTGGVREVVLDGLDLHLLQIETELLQTPLDALLVSVI